MRQVLYGIERMGASHPKYYSNKEAIAILGEETWGLVYKQLEAVGLSKIGYSSATNVHLPVTINYATFAILLYQRYDRMVSLIVFIF